MNKYLSIYKTSLKQESKTIGNSLLAVLSFIVIIYIFKQLWSFIYGENGGGQLIHGYTLEMMIWYMIMAEVLLYASNSRKITKSVGDDIKSGKIAYQLNKPYNYFFYQISNQMGISSWQTIFLLPVAIVVGIILLGPIANFKFYFIFPIILSVIIAVLINCIVYSTIGLLSFWVEEARPFTWIFQKFIMLFGLFFPPEFFP